MIIKTITCHDVYNPGASLQAYALACFLQRRGHTVEIINYKPNYLRHYELTGVRNPRFDKPLIKQLYQIAKFPGRLKARFSPNKRAFDCFTKQYLPVTKETYRTNEELKANVPIAEVFIAGSDQIWNPVFQNGKDPAFFLDFVPAEKKRVSYGASFAVDSLKPDEYQRMQNWLSRFDSISVRESSGVELVRKMGLSAVAVCDPVFLLEKEHWLQFIRAGTRKPYCFVYDFDGNGKIWEIARQISNNRKLELVSAFSTDKSDRIVSKLGPIEFINLIYHAEVIISNSFHATAFSIIFGRDFYVFNRQENINTRLHDLLRDIGTEDRLVLDDFEEKEINWAEVYNKLDIIRKTSQVFLDNCLQ